MSGLSELMSSRWMPLAVSFLAVVTAQVTAVLSTTALVRAGHNPPFWITELMKLVGTLVAVSRGSSTASIGAQLAQESAHTMMWATILGVLYAVNNNMAALVFTHTYPASAMVFKSLGVVLIAVSSTLVGDARISHAQWYTILFQVSGVILMQWDDCSQSFVTSTTGYILMTMSTLITAGTAVANSRFAKSCNSVHAFNTVLYGTGTILNLGVALMSPTAEGSDLITNLLSPAGLLFCAANAGIGQAITMLYRHGDAVVKTFASATVSVVLFVASFFAKDMNPRVSSALGAICAAASVVQFAVLTVPAAPSTPVSSASASTVASYHQVAADEEDGHGGDEVALRGGAVAGARGDVQHGDEDDEEDGELGAPGARRAKAIELLHRPIAAAAGGSSTPHALGAR